MAAALAQAERLEAAQCERPPPPDPRAHPDVWARVLYPGNAHVVCATGGAEFASVRDALQQLRNPDAAGDGLTLILLPGVHEEDSIQARDSPPFSPLAAVAPRQLRDRARCNLRSSTLRTSSARAFWRPSRACAQTLPANSATRPCARQLFPGAPLQLLGWADPTADPPPDAAAVSELRLLADAPSRAPPESVDCQLLHVVGTRPFAVTVERLRLVNTMHAPRTASHCGWVVGAASLRVVQCTAHSADATAFATGGEMQLERVVVRGSSGAVVVDGGKLTAEECIFAKAPRMLVEARGRCRLRAGFCGEALLEGGPCAPLPAQWAGTRPLAPSCSRGRSAQRGRPPAAPQCERGRGLAAASGSLKAYRAARTARRFATAAPPRCPVAPSRTRRGRVWRRIRAAAA